MYSKNIEIKDLEDPETYNNSEMTYKATEDRK
jgi:hypothetical protein